MLLYFDVFKCSTYSDVVNYEFGKRSIQIEPKCNRGDSSDTRSGCYVLCPS